ncbi:interleukin-21 [Nerophis ophidion]|uniref:interleukin-21 n=1 Tax=Nerophis ophidion TaxID=159077 RepID=UPI002AE09D32|nr:interleukin-21 [Nerophis ophidion]
MSIKTCGGQDALGFLSLTNGADGDVMWRKLKEVLQQLNKVKDSLQRRHLLVSTPPQDIEDCCCPSALQCFKYNLQQFNLTEREQRKFHRGLKHSLTEKAMDFCASGQPVNKCKTCDSYPKKNAMEFLQRLESLIIRAIDIRSRK